MHLAGGLPGFAVTGLPAAAVRESKDRVRAALQTCGFQVPVSRVTVHLGPADIPKHGGRFDLPIALGVIQAEQKLQWGIERTEFLGELALNGDVKPINGRLTGRARGAMRMVTASCCRRRMRPKPRSSPTSRRTLRSTSPKSSRI